MVAPSEPLLPVDPPSPSRAKLWIGGGAAAALLAGAALFFAFRGGEAGPSEVPPAGPDGTAPRAAKPDPARRVPEEPAPASAENRRARELYEAAEAFERAEPAEYEKRIQRWREVVTRFPTTAWARKAD